MVLYLSIIFVAMAIIIVFNCLFGGYAFDNSTLWVILTTTLMVVGEILIQGLFAFIVHSLPNKWFDGKKFFEVSRKERKFYEKLKIKSWKDKVFELGALGGFRKNKIKDPGSPEYLKEFIIESNKGVIIHITGMIMGSAIMFVLPIKYILRITLWVYLVGFLLSLLPTFILRYNIPKLQVAYERAVRTLKNQTKLDNKENIESSETKANQE